MSDLETELAPNPWPKTSMQHKLYEARKDGTPVVPEWLKKKGFNCA